MKGPKLTLERANELLIYDDQGAVLRWKVDRYKRMPHGGYALTCRAGEIAGRIGTNGYWRVKIDGRQYLSHRVIWLLTHGEWPLVFIDHHNGDRADNRLENIREATRSENAWNQGKTPLNTSGMKGVMWHKRERRWHARIKVNQKGVHLGSFATKEEAAAAYAEGAARYHGEFARPK